MAERKQALAWITIEGSADVIMETTGTYWKAVFNRLEGHVRVALANPQEAEARQGTRPTTKTPGGWPICSVTRW